MADPNNSFDLLTLAFAIAKWGLLIILLIYIASCIKIVREYERLVVFHLGRIRPVRGPGFCFVLPFLERAERVDMRINTLDLDPQDVITRDNVSVKVKAVLYYQVIDAVKSEIEIDGYEEAAQRMATTALRNIGGKSELDELLSGADSISSKVRDLVDAQTEPWGVRISLVEIKNIDVPDEMRRAIAAQAEAERQRRAKVIAAEGELQASEKLTEAAKRMSEYPMSIQLRYMQTLLEIGAENNTTVIFPLPMELLGK